MRCNKARKLISPFVDDELSAGEKELFESHIKECGKCRTEFEEMQNVHNLFARSERFSAPYGFSARVLANREINTARKEVSIPLFPRFASVVVVLIVIGLGVVSGRFLGSSFSLQATGNLAASLSLDVFSATPPDSLGGAYLAMTEVRNEK